MINMLHVTVVNISLLLSHVTTVTPATRISTSVMCQMVLCIRCYIEMHNRQMFISLLAF